MNYILTSSNKNLRDKFNSESFSNNFATDYDKTFGKFKLVLRLPVEKPVVGDYLYFINNYYEQIPVKVVSLAYGSGSCMIWCEEAELWEIDPFIYSSSNKRVYTNDFENKVVDAFNHIDFGKVIENAKKEYNNDNINELNVIVTKIIEYASLDNTAIDYTNVRYAVCDILKARGESFAKDWKRPERWEYETM